MFKTDQENKQLLWQVFHTPPTPPFSPLLTVLQLKSTQGADERLAKTLEQLHLLQGQNIDQTSELKKVRNENTRMAEEVRELHDHLRGLVAERVMVFSELDRINSTCSDLHSLVT